MADGTKKWWTSKTVWAGIVSALIVAYNSLSGSFGLPSIPEYIYGILAAFGIYSRATATTTLTK